MGTLEQIAGQVAGLQGQAAEQAAQEAIYEGVAAYFVPWCKPNVAFPAAAVVGANNQVRVSRFWLPFTIEVANLMIEVVGTSAATTLGVGIYNYDGTELLLSGTASSASAGVKTIAISPAVIIGPGLFLLAWTDTSTTPTVTGQTSVGAWNTIVNNTNAHQGTAANSSSSGVLPSATGAITGATIAIPLVKIEGA